MQSVVSDIEVWLEANMAEKHAASLDSLWHLLAPFHLQLSMIHPCTAIQGIVLGQAKGLALGIVIGFFLELFVFQLA